MDYTVKRTITLRDADAAGILFFARYLSLAHDVYEEFMASKGVRFAEYLREGRVIVPIIHTESDYHISLGVGEQVKIQLHVTEVGKRSFKIRFEFYNAQGQLAASCRTVHVAVDRQLGTSIALPADLLAALGVREESSLK